MVCRDVNLSQHVNFDRRCTTDYFKHKINSLTLSYYFLFYTESNHDMKLIMQLLCSYMYAMLLKYFVLLSENQSELLINF